MKAKSNVKNSKAQTIRTDGLHRRIGGIFNTAIKRMILLSLVTGGLAMLFFSGVGEETSAQNKTLQANFGAPRVSFRYTNSTPITINDNSTADPYSSDITVGGGVGAVDFISVELNGLSHTFPDDLDIILVGPTGARSCFARWTSLTVSPR